MIKIIQWERLPKEMQTEDVKVYYDILTKKTAALFFKRVFDIVVSFCLLVMLSPLFLVLAVAIKLDSKGPVFFRQERVTQYNRTFRIHKFRTMVQGADKGAQVTVDKDARITKVGNIIRKCRLDEISQLIDVFKGEMTLVGTRPEVPKYTKAYNAEMMATLLLPAGITSKASIYFKDEAEMLSGVEDIDAVYVSEILPKKMKYNLEAIREFSFWKEIWILFLTVKAVIIGGDIDG